jgi:hypothetical protein
LNGIVSYEIRNDKPWPKDARAMSGRVRRLAPLLRQAGMEVDFELQGHERTKVIKLSRKAAQTSDRCDRVSG